MDAHPEVNWSQVLRNAVRRYARAQEIARQLLDEEDDPRVQAVAALLKQRSGERWREAVAEVVPLDADDAPYFAALLATGADVVWTRDRLLPEWFPGICVQVVPGAPPSAG